MRLLLSPLLVVLVAGCSLNPRGELPSANETAGTPNTALDEPTPVFDDEANEPADFTDDSIDVPHEDGAQPDGKGSTPDPSSTDDEGDASVSSDGGQAPAPTADGGADGGALQSDAAPADDGGADAGSQR